MADRVVGIGTLQGVAREVLSRNKRTTCTSGWMIPITSAITRRTGKRARNEVSFGTVAPFVAGVVVIRRDNRWRRRDETRRQDELRKQQAELITGCWDPDTSEFELINNSKGLVYRVVVVLDHQLKPGHRDIDLIVSDLASLAPLPPGTKRVSLRSKYADSEVVSRQSSIRFNDAAGHHWMRRNLGELIETDEDPLDYLVQLHSKLEEQTRSQEQKAQQLLSELDDEASG